MGAFALSSVAATLDMDGTPPVDLSLIGVGVGITGGASPTKVISVHRRYERSAYNWKVYESGNLIATDTTHGDGTATITCEQDGDALNWAVALDGDEIATGTIDAIDWSSMSETTVYISCTRPTTASWKRMAISIITTMMRWWESPYFKHQKKARAAKTCTIF